MLVRTVVQRTVALSLLLLLAACSTAQPATEAPAATEAPVEAPAEEKVLVLGDISDDPGEVIEGTQPLADYLATALADYGYTRGEVRVAASADEMTELLKNGEVDFYFDSVYPATLIADASGATPVLRRWRFGVGEYHTVFFVRADSEIESLEDLVGQIISFDAPFSTSGFAVPAYYLTEAGYTMQGLAGYDSSPDPDKIGFVFSYDDPNTLQWVLDGLVAAGATDNGSFGFYAGDNADQYRIIGETEAVPRQVMVARAGLDQAVIDLVSATLIEMENSDEGLAVLETFGNTDRFDAFPEGIEAAFARMREIRDVVQAIELP